MQQRTTKKIWTANDQSKLITAVNLYGMNAIRIQEEFFHLLPHQFIAKKVYSLVQKQFNIKAKDIVVYEHMETDDEYVINMLRGFKTLMQTSK